MNVQRQPPAPQWRVPDRGASLVEYALLVALLAMVCIAAVTALGATTSEQFSQMSSELDAA